MYDRQGENVSSFLFTIFLNDLSTFIKPACVGLSLYEGIASNIDDRLSTVLQLHILLYADDSVLLAETPNDLQKCIKFMEAYCNTWGGGGYGSLGAKDKQFQNIFFLA